MGKFLNIETIEDITLSDDFYIEVRKAYEYKQYGEIIKLIIDLYIDVRNNTKYRMPNPIRLDDFRYIGENGWLKNFGQCPMLLPQSSANYFVDVRNNLYKYKGFICRFEVERAWGEDYYIKPRIAILGKEEDIQDLDIKAKDGK